MHSFHLPILMAALGTSSVAYGQTAREAYQELARANGLNPLATLVCFPDKETGSFAVASLSPHFEETLKAKGLPVPTAFQKAALSGADELLYWQGFDKGVPGGTWFLNKDGDSAHWSLKFDALGGKPEKGEIRISINWATLRYRLDIQLATMIQAAPFYGRCEPIS